MTPRLVTVAHGTRVQAGNRIPAAITARAARRLGVSATTSYVELCEPTFAEVMAGNAAPAVVVPLLLSTGYHVSNDLPAAAATSHAPVRLTRPLGPHPLLAEVMAHRLLGAGARLGDPVVMVAAGSNDPAAASDLGAAARQLGFDGSLAGADANVPHHLALALDPGRLFTWKKAARRGGGRFDVRIVERRRSGRVPAVRRHAVEDEAVQAIAGVGIVAAEGFDDDERLADLDAAVRDPSTHAVWAIRGGYGTMRLLERVDFAAVRRQPKVFIGFSDNTALHLGYARYGVVSFHGPHAGATLTAFTRERLQCVVGEPSPAGVLPQPAIVHAASGETGGQPLTNAR